MSLEEQFHQAMLNVYDQAGREAGYWAHYFLRAVRRYGGLEYAHRILQVRKNDSIQKGLQALIDSGRIDISMEALVLRPEFRCLFSDSEIQEARRRMQDIPGYAHRKTVSLEALFPEVIPPEVPYSEGAARKVTINAFERNPQARAACLAKHGYSCAVCGFDFSKKYGAIGKGFIHVHHNKPLATIRSEYVIDPIRDLVPVCPNCHAMLHTTEPPLSVTELKAQIEASSGNAQGKKSSPAGNRSAALCAGR
jgi:5-methylcytosine-specific restriction protein A